MRKTAFLLIVAIIMLLPVALFAVPCPTRACGMGIDEATIVKLTAPTSPPCLATDQLPGALTTQDGTTVVAPYTLMNAQGTYGTTTTPTTPTTPATAENGAELVLYTLTDTTTGATTSMLISPAALPKGTLGVYGQARVDGIYLTQEALALEAKLQATRGASATSSTLQSVTHQADTTRTAIGAVQFDDLTQCAWTTAELVAPPGIKGTACSVDVTGALSASGSSVQKTAVSLPTQSPTTSGAVVSKQAEVQVGVTQADIAKQLGADVEKKIGSMDAKTTVGVRIVSEGSTIGKCGAIAAMQKQMGRIEFATATQAVSGRLHTLVGMGAQTATQMAAGGQIQS